MWVARHFRRRLLILSVSTLGFFISTFSVVLALDFTASAPSSPSSTATPSKSYTTTTLNASVSAGSTALRKAKPTARGVCMRSKKGPTRQVFVVKTFHDGAGKRV